MKSQGRFKLKKDKYELTGHIIMSAFMRLVSEVINLTVCLSVGLNCAEFGRFISKNEWAEVENHLPIS